MPPHHVIDYLALIGDSARTTCRARSGIGPKTAIQLIQQFGGVEAILERAGEVSNKRAREALIECADDVRLSKELVTIRCDLPVELDLDTLRVQEPESRRSCASSSSTLEFTTLVRDYAPTGRGKARPRSGATTAHVVRSAEEVDRLVERARKLGHVAINVESTSQQCGAR